MDRKILYKDKNIEIVVITLEPGYVGEYHYHDGNKCTMCILEGQMIEELRAFENDLPIISYFHENEKHYIDDTIGSHRVSTVLGSKSLHVYSKL
jgi:hypothetical protein